jgi:hypothetical protein
MKRFITYAALLPLALLALLPGCSSEAESEEPKEMTEEELIQRGEYLTTIMDCNTCHSPKLFEDGKPVPDPARMLSGHPGDRPLDISGFDLSKTPIGPWVFAYGEFTGFVGPWGISYAANITPDPTGIGNFTLENFKMAFQHGKYKGGEGGRMLMPPMPYETFAHLPDEDVKAIYTYLMKKVRPVNNVPPAYTPPAGPPPGAPAPAGTPAH